MQEVRMSFWRMPWNRSIGPIGLDLGADQPRAMQVRHGPDAVRRLLAIGAEQGEDLVRRAGNAARAMRRAGFVGRDVVVGLPSSNTRMHVARMPAGLGERAASAIVWEASQRHEMPNERVVADAVPTGAPSQHGDGKEEQLVVAADADEVERAMAALIEEGFDPIAAEPRFMSVARAASRRTRRDADAGNVRAVLHVEQHGSIILVVRGDRVAFCREIPVGGETLDHAVASRLSVSLDAAASLRADRMAAARGLAPSVDDVADEAALAAARGTIDSLAGEVALCLRYYGVTFRGGQPGRVVISGPHGAEPRLAAIVEETTRAEVVSIDQELPQHAIESLRAATPSGDASAWITAFGLACRERYAQAEAPARKRSAA
jgi:Tfp pilus assembly PilM family ATPase